MGSKKNTDDIAELLKIVPNDQNTEFVRYANLAVSIIFESIVNAKENIKKNPYCMCENQKFLFGNPTDIYGDINDNPSSIFLWTEILRNHRQFVMELTPEMSESEYMKIWIALCKGDKEFFDAVAENLDNYSEEFQYNYSSDDIENCLFENLKIHIKPDRDMKFRNKSTDDDSDKSQLKMDI